MGILSKIFKPIKKVVKKVGKFIKRVAKKVGGAFGKLGILGHIGMMFLMPYASSFWGSLGKFGTQLVQGTSLAGKGFGHLMRGIYHAGKAVGTVYRGVTEAVEGSLKWLSNKVGLTDIADPFSGLKTVVQDAQNWGRAGWKGTRIHEISTAGLPQKRLLPDGTVARSATPAELRNEIPTVQGGNVAMMGDPNVGSYDTTTGPTIDTVKDVATPPDQESQSLLGKLGEDAKQKFRETIVDAPSMVARDVLKTGVQKSIMGTPQTSYGGSVSFTMAGTGDILSYNDIGSDPNNLYSQGYNVGSPFMQAFGTQYNYNDGWDEYMEMLAPSGNYSYK